MTSGNHKLEAWEMTQLIKYMLCIHEDSRHPRKSLVCVCVCVRASRVETGRSQSPPTSQSSQLVSSRISERPCLKEKGMESYRGRPLALTSGAHIHVLAVCTNTYLTDTFFQKRKIVIIAVRLKKKGKNKFTKVSGKVHVISCGSHCEPTFLKVALEMAVLC